MHFVHYALLQIMPLFLKKKKLIDERIFLERVFKYLKNDCYRHVVHLVWIAMLGYLFPPPVLVTIGVSEVFAPNESNEAQNRRQINLSELFVNLTFNPRSSRSVLIRKVHHALTFSRN